MTPASLSAIVRDAHGRCCRAQPSSGSAPTTTTRRSGCWTSTCASWRSIARSTAHRSRSQRCAHMTSLTDDSQCGAYTPQITSVFSLPPALQNLHLGRRFCPYSRERNRSLCACAADSLLQHQHPRSAAGVAGGGSYRRGAQAAAQTRVVRYCDRTMERPKRWYRFLRPRNRPTREVGGAPLLNSRVLASPV